MSDNMMPERIEQRDGRHRPVEYIRADVAAAQLDTANKRIAELEMWLRYSMRYLEGDEYNEVSALLSPPNP